MDNQNIAKIFQEIGDILEIMNENVFRIRSYRRAALTIANYPYEMSDLYTRDSKLLEKIPGIGSALRDKIIELIKTGKCKEHAELLKKFPKGFLDILRIRTVGPKKLQLFYGKLGIKNIEQLKLAAMRGRLRDLPGMGEKSEKEILEAIKEYSAMPHERRLLHDAMIEADRYIEYMKKSPEVELIEPAGSLRRRLETIGDIDILCASKKPAKIMEYFVKYPAVANVLSKGGTKSAVVLKNGMQVDLRVIDKKVFGAALHYFTGSKAHNIRIRDRAKKMGLKISEYGVFRGAKLIAGKTEKEVFASVGFPYIEPEMREDRGEIELAARHGKFPKLINLADLCGDLHIHSKWSDGTAEIEEIAKMYKERGFKYIAITDHSPTVGVAHGLTEDRLEMQWDEIDEINKNLGRAKAGVHGQSFKILKGAEVDIRKNGELDYPDKILKQLDIVVASVHMRLKLTEEEQTKRIITALKNPYVTILGHPSGRLIGSREPLKFDMEAVIKAAIDSKVVLEINSFPDRLDLQDIYVKMAKELGAKFAISSDSHNLAHFEYLKYGVFVGRRGWLEAKDVINTWPIVKLLEFFAKKR